MPRRSAHQGTTAPVPSTSAAATSMGQMSTQTGPPTSQLRRPPRLHFASWPELAHYYQNLTEEQREGIRFDMYTHIVNFKL